ncbi:GSCFA domain-containing protein [Rhodopila globiformis]|uniref:GSCFA domain-containing protein n=1 Tax=Rhodopila globiformis TaxID=1071 RepID=A0A2S6N1J2_RHOGL|nr:GSCFA domain-containing protein [Rhodopila globiformis]PPQ28469.1 GSCFA domain-containing protein [Rhodopila globiformis]
MSDHPYRNLPAASFWKRSVAEVPADKVDPVVRGKFHINQMDRVATAGSCFAQHIARHLAMSGFNYFVSERENPVIPGNLAAEYGYGLFTARYGNIYTSRQLLQLLKRAYGLFQPVEDVWHKKNGSLVDPYRPQIQPDGFASLAEYLADRQQHFAAVRRAIEELDVFVFTLGLTETWASEEDGSVYPVCPGVAGGTFDERRHRFVNLTVAEVCADLREAIEFIRVRNPASRFILTVSPVPLVATAADRSVIVSTTYSKSVLRVAAQEIADKDENIAYFPSYEIITGQHARGKYFAADLRSVTEEGVSRVMELFMQHYAQAVPEAPPVRKDSQAMSSEQEIAIGEAIAVMCDEEALDR